VTSSLPSGLKGVRQQRQHPGAGSPGLAGAHLGQQDLNQVVVDRGVGFLGWFGDGHPQLPPGHRGDQRLRCLWYRLRLTVAEMNYATRRTVELQVPWISDNRPGH